MTWLPLLFFFLFQLIDVSELKWMHVTNSKTPWLVGEVWGPVGNRGVAQTNKLLWLLRTKMYNVFLNWARSEETKCGVNSDHVEKTKSNTLAE
jgi:hypothetical protein